MREDIKRRLKALERAAEKEALLSIGLQVALAYYLGGLKQEKDLAEAYARALGYSSLQDHCGAVAELLKGSSSVDIERRAREAQRRLFAKFGYKLDGSRPAALKEALYKIIQKLPDQWITYIKSAIVEAREDEARADEVWNEALQLAAGSARKD